MRLIQYASNAEHRLVIKALRVQSGTRPIQNGSNPEQLLVFKA